MRFTITHEQEPAWPTRELQARKRATALLRAKQEAGWTPQGMKSGSRVGMVNVQPAIGQNETYGISETDDLRFKAVVYGKNRERIPCDEIYMTIKQARAGQRKKCRELGLTEKEGMTPNRRPRAK